MGTVHVFQLIGKKVLVARESARSIKPAMAAAFGDHDGLVVLDLSGIDGITPSFLDESLLVAEECVADAGEQRLALKIAHPPTTLSSKFMAVARAHGLSIRETDFGDWQFNPTR